MEGPAKGDRIPEVGRELLRLKGTSDHLVKIIDDLEGKFLHIRVGGPSLPATDEQISDIQNNIIELFEKNNINCLAFVTHHAVTMDIIEKESKD